MKTQDESETNTEKNVTSTAKSLLSFQTDSRFSQPSFGVCCLFSSSLSAMFASRVERESRVCCVRSEKTDCKAHANTDTSLVKNGDCQENGAISSST